LTVSTIHGLLLVAGGQTFALPVTTLVRVTRARAADLRSTGGRDVLPFDGSLVPVASLAAVLGVQAATPREPGTRFPLVVMTSGDRRVAVVVDELIGMQDLVVKRLGPRLRGVRHFAGATILPTGRVALILNAAEVVEGVVERSARSTLRAAPAHVQPEEKVRVLLVDDSMTTRSLEQSILEAGGYAVTAAADGEQAWQLLQEHGADLVVADVDMPRMDGVALCEAIRESKRFREVPVVLLTARASDRDKARGLEAGANAYLAKGAFDQRQLLETIAQLL
jgi:two-component system chemotaxis sensor kinase CheA